MGEPFAKSDDVRADIDYHKRHRIRGSFRRAVQLANFWPDCTSALDVGCRSTGFLYQLVPRYKIRVGTDIYKPLYMGGDDPDVLFVHGDFLKIQFNNLFDVVVCMETMEHIDPSDRRAFATKLMSLAKKHLLVSIPYMWKGSKEPIDHNGFNETHIQDWFQRTDFLRTVTGRPAIGRHLLARFDNA